MKEFPFEHEDRRQANYWIVRWLQWERNRSDDALTQKLYQALLDSWNELCVNAKSEEQKENK